jgi:hypothetical protein
VRDAPERLRPLASEALLVIFQQVMSETVEEVTGRDPAYRPERSRGRRGHRRSAAGSLSNRSVGDERRGAETSAAVKVT